MSSFKLFHYLLDTNILCINKYESKFDLTQIMRFSITITVLKKIRITYICNNKYT